MNYILQVKNIKKEYGKRSSRHEALKGVSFNVSSGEFVGIMGASGAGKSTLLNIISTLDVQSFGSILIDEEDISKKDSNQIADFRRDKLGFVFQESNLLSTLTIKENIMLPLTLKNEKALDIDKSVDQVSNQLGISEILNKYPHEVSGGQKQRATVCRAIITNPSLILADEPTGSLDSKSARDLLDCFVKLKKQKNSTILMVTHDVMSASYCDRILFIKDGVIFTEIIRGEDNREFYKKIIDTVSIVGGAVSNDTI